MSRICKTIVISIVMGIISCSSLTEVKAMASVEAAVGEEETAAEAGITRDQMTTVEIEKLAEFMPPEQGAYLQGGTMTSGRLLMAFLPGDSSEGNPLLVLDADNWQTVSTQTEDLSHANDLCYDSTTGEIFVLQMDSPQIIVLDGETLRIERTIDTPQTYHAIGYDENKDCFAAIYAYGEGRKKRLTCDILDNTAGQG